MAGINIKVTKMIAGAISKTEEHKKEIEELKQEIDILKIALNETREVIETLRDQINYGPNSNCYYESKKSFKLMSE